MAESQNIQTNRFVNTEQFINANQFANANETNINYPYNNISIPTYFPTYYTNQNMITFESYNLYTYIEIIEDICKNENINNVNNDINNNINKNRTIVLCFEFFETWIKMYGISYVHSFIITLLESGETIINKLISGYTNNICKNNSINVQHGEHKIYNHASIVKINNNFDYSAPLIMKIDCRYFVNNKICPLLSEYIYASCCLNKNYCSQNILTIDTKLPYTSTLYETKYDNNMSCIFRANTYEYNQFKKQIIGFQICRNLEEYSILHKYISIVNENISNNNYSIINQKILNDQARLYTAACFIPWKSATIITQQTQIKYNNKYNNYNYNYKHNDTCGDNNHADNQKQYRYKQFQKKSHKLKTKDSINGSIINKNITQLTPYKIESSMCVNDKQHYNDPAYNHIFGQNPKNTFDMSSYQLLPNL